MDDLKNLMKVNYLQYASYVILDRAIPNIVDGLKPVQRRILFTLFRIHDGRLHKVMNVAGQTMALHPHGDAPIIEALVNMSNKGYMLDQQGNFGNILTGDPAAAARYIETRLSSLSKETMFNPDLTEMIASYDSRNLEPVVLPAKIPLLLLQGADGIAVGMSTRILPHNFVELLEAEIAILEGREYEVLPDFPTGGIMDATEYDKGRGRIKLRARIEIQDPKTIVIREICYATTTESLIRSIDEAAKRGKIKIDAINDYTASKVEIEIKLPRGQYAEELIDALYAYTECEVSVNSQVVVVKDEYPLETDVNHVLEYHVEKLQGYLKRELEIERDRLLEKIFNKSLERIFIENRLYKQIENVSTYDKIHETIEISLKPFHKELYRLPTYDDRESLLNIPIRRISRFDLDKNKEEVADTQEKLEVVEKDLKDVKKYTIRYLKHLIKTYGKDFARRTQTKAIEQVDRRAIDTRQIKVGFDPATGFVGTKVVSDHVIECTNFDKLLLMYKDGTYTVINIPEKQYVTKDKTKVVFVGVADKKTILNLVYSDPKTRLCYVKRFIITAFTLGKTYRYFEEGMALEYITAAPNHILTLKLLPKPRLKQSKIELDFNDTLVKGVSAKGNRVSKNEIKRVEFLREQPAKT
ncbi:MAG: DNA topoisomerase IV subunit A [Chlamydiales bacterium]|nr:DNA topoisomerase IV subunit A [Chlamydiales bacterium]